jgi:MFS family permease
MLGPLLGGVIIHYFHWSVIFFVNIPIGLVGLTMMYRHMPDFRAAKNDPLDIIGLTFITATLVFWELKPSDGDAVSSHKAQVPAE